MKRLNEVFKNLTYEANCDIEKVEIDGIEFNLKQELENKLVVVFENSLEKYKTTISDIEMKNPSAIISSENIESSIPHIKVENLRKCFSKMCSNFYGNPEENLKIIFVTGTNGKTSTTKIISEILNVGKIKTGTIGTLGSDFGQVHWNSELTTPDPNVLFKVMSEMLKLGCECVVMEASSHALYLEKLSSLYAEVGVLTNCARDHLDFFKTIERYQDAKYKMFDQKMIKW
ncbi:MAG: Mur ligase family protein, partial [Clostridia bacterium]